MYRFLYVLAVVKIHNFIDFEIIDVVWFDWRLWKSPFSKEFYTRLNFRILFHLWVENAQIRNLLKVLILV